MRVSQGIGVLKFGNLKAIGSKVLLCTRREPAELTKFLISTFGIRALSTFSSFLTECRFSWYPVVVVAVLNMC